MKATDNIPIELIIQRGRQIQVSIKSANLYKKVHNKG